MGITTILAAGGLVVAFIVLVLIHSAEVDRRGPRR